MPSFTVFVASLFFAFAPVIGHVFITSHPASHSTTASRPVLHPLDVVGGSPTVH